MHNFAPINILLIGPRGCGKSAIGNALAQRLSRPFIDLDQQTLRQFDAATVTQVWSRYGQDAWRAAELEALRAAIAQGGQVIALGGGTPMIPEARDLLQRARDRGAAIIIYLRAANASLVQRLRQNPGDRPSLTGQSLEQEVVDIIAAREPTYLALATLQQRSDIGDLEQIVGELAAKLQDFKAKSS